MGKSGKIDNRFITVYVYVSGRKKLRIMHSRGHALKKTNCHHSVAHNEVNLGGASDACHCIILLIMLYTSKGFDGMSKGKTCVFSVIHIYRK